ncbi:hypothetical protein [Streptomyces sp. NPDC006997]|uniref:hypothetical protein n=1 Tax=Streptomyces sp. NPDC006997 TaxID=3155356 RepID=UPI0033F59912
MTRVRTALLAVAAATVSALGVAAPVVAAPATSVQAAPAQERAAAGLDVYRGRYLGWADCDKAGRQGVERGHWDQYQCAEGRVFWHLWTNR